MQRTLICHKFRLGYNEVTFILHINNNHKFRLGYNEVTFILHINNNLSIFKGN